MRLFDIIFATDEKGGFGYKGGLPWNNKEDIEFYKNKTLGQCVIMGRNTYESVRGPLKDRLNIVLSKTKNNDDKENVIFIESLDKALTYMMGRLEYENIFVIGGKYLIEEAYNHPNMRNIWYNKIEGTYSSDIKVENILRYPIISKKETPIVTYYRMIGENKEEQREYLDLVRNILENGEERNDRTGTGTLSIFGAQSRYSLRDETIPLLTTKKVYWKGVAEELFWFIKGCTDNDKLVEKGVKIWNGNSTREFLDSRGLGEREEGDLGPIYGFQWRHFGAEYKDRNENYKGKGIDQLRNVIDVIKNEPESRRIIMTAWNPSSLNDMALPPCHIMCQFYVSKERRELSCHMYQRSCDIGLGVPFNIASYSLLTIILAHIAGLKPGEFIHSMGDVHIYKNHIEGLREQIERIPRQFPKIKIKCEPKDIEEYTIDDFEVMDYDPYPSIKMDMAI